MRYLVCYKFSEKGRWYIYKDCAKDNLLKTIEAAFQVKGVVEIKVSMLNIRERSEKE